MMKHRRTAVSQHAQGSEHFAKNYNVLYQAQSCTAFDEIMTVISTLVLHLTVIGFPLLYPVMVYLALRDRDVYVITMVLALALGMAYPPRIHTWPEFVLDNPLWRAWRHYFSFSIVAHKDLDKSDFNKHFLMAEAPHAIFPMGQWLSQSVLPRLFPRLRYTKGGAADVVFRIPILREVYGWMGIVSATRSSLHEAYQQGYNVAVIPGGIAEQMRSDPTKERLYLQSHRGYARWAIQHGTDILPVYVLGNTQILSRVSTGRGILTRLSRKLRMSLVLPYGRWYLPIPRRHPLIMMIGLPVAVTQEDVPSKEQVEFVHQEVMKRVEGLFHAGKHRLGPQWEQRDLEVL